MKKAPAERDRSFFRERSGMQQTAEIGPSADVHAPSTEGELEAKPQEHDQSDIKFLQTSIA